MLIKYSCNLFSHYFITKKSGKLTWFYRLCAKFSSTTHSRSCHFSLLLFHNACSTNFCMSKIWYFYSVFSPGYSMSGAIFVLELFWGVSMSFEFQFCHTYTHSDQRGKSEDVTDPQRQVRECTWSPGQVRWGNWSPDAGKMMYLVTRGK